MRSVAAPPMALWGSEAAPAARGREGSTRAGTRAVVRRGRRRTAVQCDRETSAGATRATAARRGTAGAEGTTDVADHVMRQCGADAREVATARCLAAGAIAVEVDRPRALHRPILRGLAGRRRGGRCRGRRRGRPRRLRLRGPSTRPTRRPTRRRRKPDLPTTSPNEFARCDQRSRVNSKSYSPDVGRL